jgi:methylglyoxal/glyoxal reductase
MRFLNIKNIGIFLFMVNIGLGASSMAIEVHSNGTCQIDNVEYPAVGFGTYPLKDKTCSTAVDQAAQSGYRIIDTATFYGNFEPIGHVLKKFGRHNFYIISKVWPDAHTPDRLNEDLKRTLKQLQTNYLDAYLLHWPNSKVSIEDTLQAMEKLRSNGSIRHIGLSNVSVNHLKRALELKIPITWVQVEMNPYFYDPELLEFCKANSITIQAWGPLGRGIISEDALLTEMGKKYGKTASQVAIRWIIQNGCIPLPGSKNSNHIQQNIEIMDFTLSQEEMQVINKRACLGKRERITADAGVGFTDEFDFSYEECWPKP